METDFNQWRKLPSVMTGGKSYFWTRGRSDDQQWIVWNRVTRSWDITGADRWVPGMRVWLSSIWAQGFKTDKVALKYAKQPANTCPTVGL